MDENAVEESIHTCFDVLTRHMYSTAARSELGSTTVINHKRQVEQPMQLHKFSRDWKKHTIRESPYNPRDISSMVISYSSYIQHSMESGNGAGNGKIKLERWLSLICFERKRRHDQMSFLALLLLCLIRLPNL